MPAPIPDQHIRATRATRSVMAWAAWQRALAVLPAIAVLWLAVAWANLEITPW